MSTPSTVRCPRCGGDFPTDFEFCPRDATRLRPTTGGDPMVGIILDGRYRIDGVVGRGGSGVVYRAQQLTVDRPVAVKVLGPEAATDAEASRRFDNEATALARLRHPNTVRIIDFGHTDDGRPYLVGPLLEGQPLDRLLTTEGPLPVDRTVALLAPVCDALAEAHAADIVHRDLKPENLFVERIGDGEMVRVLDFGIALLRDGDRLTADGTSVGTAAYMAPEQVRGERVDARCDIYAFGALLFRCLAGRPPFEGDTRIAVVMQHLRDDPPPLPHADREPARRAMADLIARCLEKHPDDRPADIGSVRRALAASGDGPTASPRAVAAPAPILTPGHGPESAPPRRIALVLAAVVAAVLAALAWSNHEPPRLESAPPPPADDLAVAEQQPGPVGSSTGGELDRGAGEPDATPDVGGGAGAADVSTTAPPPRRDAAKPGVPPRSESTASPAPPPSAEDAALPPDAAPPRPPPGLY